MSLDREDKFVLALVISIMLHSLSLIVLTFTQQRAPEKKFNRIQVVYQAASSVDESSGRLAELQPLQDQKSSPTPEILAKKGAGPVPLMKELTKSPGPLKVESK